MSVFMVSFRLKEDSTYEERYESFIEQLQKTGLWWADTTSYLIVKTEETIDDFCHRIYFKSKIIDSKDLFLVLDDNTKSGRVRGPVKDQYLFTLMPYVKKLD